MPGLNPNTQLLLHLDSDYTDSSDQNHTVTDYNGATISAGASKFGGGSAFFDGSDDYLLIADSPSWDIFGNFRKSYSIDLWVKHLDHDGQELYLRQQVDSQDRWILQHQTAGGTGVQFFYEQDNVVALNINGGEITDTNWHHIAAIVISNGSGWDCGIYKDGNQIAYGSVNQASSDTFDDVLSIGASETGTLPFYGYLEEVRIQRGNWFNAAPNAGLTDTITVPTEAYSLEKNKGLIFS